jgi:DNA processing protein
LAVAALARVVLNPVLVGRLLAGWGPVEAWEALRGGQHPLDPEGRWQEAARRLDLGGLGAVLDRFGVRVLGPGDPWFPTRLAERRGGPRVLFVRGQVATLGAGPVVAVIGSRAATGYGQEVARWFGTTLADAGVVVAGGLSRGIEAAAHAGALVATGPGPLAVVGGGLGRALAGDERRQQAAVVSRGALVSELPPGVPERPWTLAMRCRLLAALAEVVVVVEAGTRSGALRTVREARRQGTRVLVVPGPVTSPASAGGHELLARGQAALACSPADVLAALGRAAPVPPGAGAADRANRGRTGRGDAAAVGCEGTRAPSGAGEVGVDGEARRVLDRLGGRPVPVDWLVEATGLPLAQVVLALLELGEVGVAVEEAGLWRRRSPGPGGG